MYIDELESLLFNAKTDQYFEQQNISMNEDLMKKLKQKGAMEISEEILKNGQQLSDSDQQILVDELKRLFQDQYLNDNFANFTFSDISKIPIFKLISPLVDSRYVFSSTFHLFLQLNNIIIYSNLKLDQLTEYSFYLLR